MKAYPSSFFRFISFAAFPITLLLAVTACTNPGDVFIGTDSEAISCRATMDCPGATSCVNGLCRVSSSSSAGHVNRATSMECAPVRAAGWLCQSSLAAVSLDGHRYGRLGWGAHRGVLDWHRYGRLGGNRHLGRVVHGHGYGRRGWGAHRGVLDWHRYGRLGGNRHLGRCRPRARVWAAGGVNRGLRDGHGLPGWADVHRRVVQHGNERLGRLTPGCATDMDCPAGLMCIAGSCSMGTSGSGGSTPGCATDMDCPAGLMCVAGLCSMGTSGSSSSTGGGLGSMCSTSADCSNGAGCFSGICMYVAPMGCMTNAQCPAGTSCYAGACQ